MSFHHEFAFHCPPRTILLGIWGSRATAETLDLSLDGLVNRYLTAFDLLALVSGLSRLFQSSI